MSESVPRPGDLPEPSPELVLIGAIVTAHLRSLPKRKRLRFLREVGGILTWFEEYADVARIRPRSDDKALAKARKGAAEWWRRMVGIFVSGDTG